MSVNSLDSQILSTSLQKLNPSIEAPVSKILDQIELNLDKPTKGTKLSVDFKDTEDGAGQKMVFNIASTLAGMPFVWNFHAKPADSSMVCAMCCKPTSINLAVSYVCSVV